MLDDVYSAVLPPKRTRLDDVVSRLETRLTSPGSIRAPPTGFFKERPSVDMTPWCPLPDIYTAPRSRCCVARR